MKTVARRSTIVALVLSAACGSEGDVDETKPESHEVEIVRDSLGVAHIYGEHDEDVMFGAGYAQAEDRLFEMEIFRRRSRGERAELLGPSVLSDDVAARTFGFRALGAADAARARAERTGDAALVEAWARGVNKRIGEIRRGEAPRPYGLGTGAGELDMVPEDWSAEDAFAVGKLLAFGLSNTLDNEILASALRGLAPDFVKAYPLLQPGWDAPPNPGGLASSPQSSPQAEKASAGQGASPWKPQAPAKLGPAPQGVRFEPPPLFSEHGASNNWAVAGAFTDNGRPLLCGDPHQVLTSPARFYPFHMSSKRDGGPGTLDVIGFAFVGTPVVELGHNARVAWTATTSFADVMDLWGVDTNDDETEVELWDGPHPLERTTETVRVKGDDGKLTEQSVVIQRVPGVGVLLPKQALPVPIGLLTKSEAILASWTGLRPSTELSAYLAMDRANDVGEWEKAVDLIEVGAQNFVGADAKSIAYRVHALVPDRGSPSSHEMPWHILDGKDGASAWSRGFLPDEKLPHLRDPEKGYIGTANGDPFGFTADGDVSNDPYYFGSFFANGSRARRINDELARLVSSGNKVTVSDMMALHRDHHSVLADAVLPRLSAALSAASGDASLAALVKTKGGLELGQKLVAWDRSMDPGRGEPLAFLGLTWMSAKRVFAGPMSALLFDAVAEKSPPYLMGALRNVIDERFPGATGLMPGGRDALLLSSLDDAAAWLEGRFGSADPSGYQLTDVQAASFGSMLPGSALDIAAVPVGGGTDTVNVAASAFFDGGKPRQSISPQDMSLYRMVVSFADDGSPEAQFSFATGVSGDPKSPHFLDQQPAWAKVDYAPLTFRRADVEAKSEGRKAMTAE